MSPSVGIVGCGAIGQAILRAADSGSMSVSVAGVTSRGRTRAEDFLATLRQPPPYLQRDQLIARSDLVIETAGGHVVPDLARETFTDGKDLMVISIGALLEHPEIIDQSRSTGCRLLAPSGAIAGLDGIKSACAGKVDHVVMVSRKPPQALEGAPYLVEREISISGLEQEIELFHGSAREACRGFPAKLTAADTFRLAGIGPDETQVKIVAVPGLERNCHDIEVKGEFGLLNVHIENIPSENPRTGKLTAMSIIRSIQDAFDPVGIGT